MSDILKIYSEKLLRQGEEIGKRIGREDSNKELIMNMLKNNKSDDEIKIMVPDCTDDLINEVRSELDEE